MAALEVPRNTLNINVALAVARVRRDTRGIVELVALIEVKQPSDITRS